MWKDLNSRSHKTDLMDILKLKCSDIEPGYNPRKNFKIDELKKSIKRDKQLVPICVRKGKQKKWQIVSGEKRWKACSELKIDVEAIPRELTDEQAANIAYIDNEDREDFTVIEKAQHMAHMRDAFGYTVREMEEKYNESKSSLGELLQISTLPDLSAQADNLSAKHLYQISKLVSRKDLISVFEEGFAKKIDKWTPAEHKQFETELKARQEEQIKMAIMASEQEWTVAETERNVKNKLYSFNARDDQIKASEKEKIKIAVKSLNEGIGKITDAVVYATDGFKSFKNAMSFFSEELFERIPQKDKEDILSELDDLEEELSKLDIKETKEDIRWFRKKIN